MLGKLGSFELSAPIYLVSNGKNRFGLRSNEVDAGICACLGKVCVLGQESIS